MNVARTSGAPFPDGNAQRVENILGLCRPTRLQRRWFSARMRLRIIQTPQFQNPGQSHLKYKLLEFYTRGSVGRSNA